MIYIANIRVPTEKAHGLQIMKTCEAFSNVGQAVTLVVPRRINPIREDPFTYYSVAPVFSIQRLPTLDALVFGKGYWIQLGTFSLAALWYAFRKKRELFYSRDEFVLYLLSFFSFKFVWESHVGKHNIFTRRVVQHAHRIVVISEGLKKLYVEYGVPSEKITVAHDGVTLADFAHAESKDAARERLGLPKDRQVVLYIGRLDGWKGADTLCSAASDLPHSVHVAVIGGEPAQVEAFKRQYPKVQFLGFHPYREIANNLSAADVVVLPNTARDQISTTFTSPLKLFTYMASKKPIIASDIPSIREVLDDTNCYFVAPDNSEELASGIQRALENPSEARGKAEKAFERVADFTWEARARSILTTL